MTTDVQPVGLKRAYPRELKLADGKKIELRLADSGSRDVLLSFARELPKQDLMFLRMDITDQRNVVAGGRRRIAILPEDARHTRPADQIVGQL